MHPIIEQTIYYFTVMILSIFLMSMVQMGFFWKFLKVRTSFGKYILCKVRAVNRDYFAVGHIEENFLVYKVKKNEKRISVKDSSVFYKAMGITWIDIDDEKNAIVKPDYSVVDGFDPVKYNNLYKRSLYSPSITDNKDKIIIGCLVLIVVLIIAVGFFIYKQNYLLEFLRTDISTVKSSVSGIVRTNI